MSVQEDSGTIILDTAAGEGIIRIVILCKHRLPCKFKKGDHDALRGRNTMNEISHILRREFIYLWYYFELQLRQIFWYWVLGIAIGSFISVFARDGIHNLFRRMQGKKWGIFGIVLTALHVRHHPHRRVLFPAGDAP